MWSTVARVAACAALAGMAVLGCVRALGMVAAAGPAGGLVIAPGGPLSDAALHLVPDLSAALLVGMVVCYGIIVAAGPAVPRGPSLAVVGALLVLFTLVPPVRRHDVFAYVAYARMGALHGVDPYSYGPAAMGPDPVDAYYAHVWRHLPTKYGPFFTLLSYGVAPLRVVDAAWALKALSAVAAAATLGLVAAAARRLDREPTDAVRFVGLNPLLLVYAIGQGHNDTLMAAVLVAGVAALAAGRDALGSALGVVSAAVKPSAAVALPFLVLGARSRRRAVAAALLAVVGVATVSAAAFGVSNRFAQTLIGHEGGRGSHSVAGLIREELGVNLLTPVGRALLLAAFVATYVALLILAWRRRLAVTTAAGCAMAAVLALSTVVFGWYLTWLVPLAALSPSRRLRAATLALILLVTFVGGAGRLI